MLENMFGPFSGQVIRVLRMIVIISMLQKLFDAYIQWTIDSCTYYGIMVIVSMLLKVFDTYIQWAIDSSITYMCCRFNVTEAVRYVHHFLGIDALNNSHMPDRIQTRYQLPATDC